jgi:hypothetical protein
MMHVQGLAIFDALEPERHGRIVSRSTDGLTVTVVWMVGQTELVKVNDHRFMVEVPLAVLRGTSGARAQR